MSDYLKNLVERTLDPSRVVQPRLASRFEPQGTFAAFGLETEEGETDPAAPAVEARAETRRAETPPRAESAPRTQAEHFTAPSVLERRPDARPHEQPPAPTNERAPDTPPTAEAFVKNETPRPTAASVEAGKSLVREETSIKVLNAGRESRPSPDSGTTHKPRVVEPRLSPLPKVFEAPSPHVPAADDAGRDDAAPTIRITIGRVDVRAVAAPAKDVRRAPEAPRPALTLEDYLRRRGGGSR